MTNINPIIVVAPDEIDLSNKKSIFIAGGISNCPDWQNEVAERIAIHTDYAVINPRRYNWNMDSQDEASIEQIKWEHKYLKSAFAILFWFCEETLCPITLFELGAALDRRGIRVFVGTHPNYARKLDVKTQVGLVRSDIKVFEDLDEMVNYTIQELN